MLGRGSGTTSGAPLKNPSYIVAGYDNATCAIDDDGVTCLLGQAIRQVRSCTSPLISPSPRPASVWSPVPADDASQNISTLDVINTLIANLQGILRGGSRESRIRPARAGQQRPVDGQAQSYVL